MEKKEYQRKTLDRVKIYTLIGVIFSLTTYAFPKLETVTFRATLLESFQ